MTLLLLAVCLAHGDDLPAPPSPGHTTVFHSTARLLFTVWSGFLTRADGERCAFEPSCSAYARQAIRREGPGGLMLTADRLLRETNAVSYPLGIAVGFRADPVSDHPPALRLLFGSWCRAQRRRGAELCL